MPEASSASCDYFSGPSRILVQMYLLTLPVAPTLYLLTFRSLSRAEDNAFCLFVTFAGKSFLTLSKPDADRWACWTDFWLFEWFKVAKNKTIEIWISFVSISRTTLWAEITLWRNWIRRSFRSHLVIWCTPQEFMFMDIATHRHNFHNFNVFCSTCFCEVAGDSVLAKFNIWKGKLVLVRAQRETSWGELFRGLSGRAPDSSSLDPCMRSDVCRADRRSQVSFQVLFMMQYVDHDRLGSSSEHKHG